MKKFLLLATVFFFSFLAIFLLKSEVLKTNTESTSPPQKQQETESNYSIDNYEVVWTVAEDGEKIRLFSNLEEKLTSEEAFLEHDCKSLVSGSFYNEQNKHIGLFAVNGNLLSESMESSTFNGFFSIDSKEDFSISSSPPADPYIAIQSGPILIYQNKTQKLNIKNDHNSRRIIIAVSEKNNIYFIAIYDKTNLINGPLLTDLPEIVLRLSEEQGLKIKAALNLDGGSHSAFLTDKISLTELSPIGSYFCIK